jgi:hypothetical protein
LRKKIAMGLSKLTKKVTSFPKLRTYKKEVRAQFPILLSIIACGTPPRSSSEEYQ